MPGGGFDARAFEAALDSEEFKASLDLIGRVGALEFTVGYMHDDVPIEEAGWYAYVRYRGVRVTTENHTSPTEAVEALAARLLKGARCNHCGGIVTLRRDGVWFPASDPDDVVPYADGESWTARDAMRAKRCRWVRQGARWEPGCG